MPPSSEHSQMRSDSRSARVSLLLLLRDAQPRATPYRIGGDARKTEGNNQSHSTPSGDLDLLSAVISAVSSTTLALLCSSCSYTVLARHALLDTRRLARSSSSLGGHLISALRGRSGVLLAAVVAPVSAGLIKHHDVSEGSQQLRRCHFLLTPSISSHTVNFILPRHLVVTCSHTAYAASNALYF